jgi:chorismate synthase
VVAEAMVCLTLADFALDKFGGDSLAETLDNAARYRERVERPISAPARMQAGSPVVDERE